MTSQTERVAGNDEVGTVRIAVNLVAIETAQSSMVHNALHKIVALHPILMRRSVLPEVEVLGSKARNLQIPDLG